MCTLFLSAGKIGRTPLNIRSLWYENFLRPIAAVAELQGSGAAGIMVANNGAVLHSKEAFPAGVFITRSPWQQLPQMGPSILGLHARSGKDYPRTASYDIDHHPFVGENIALMHEGWIDHDWFEDARRFNIPLETTTDSELVMRVIDGYPTLIEGVRALFGQFPLSVFGLVIWDRRQPRTIHFVSNGRRCSPYHIFYSSLFRTVNLISRFSMVEIALSGIEREQMGIEDVVQSKPNILYTFDYKGNIEKQEI